MSNRLMGFGAVMYDAWWMFVLILAAAGGIGWALQTWAHLWFVWAIALPLSFAVGWFGARAVFAWHDRQEARRQEARRQEAERRFWAVGDTGISASEAERALRKWNGGDDGERD